MEEDFGLHKEKRMLYMSASALLGLLSLFIVVAIIGGFLGISYFDKAAKGENVITVTGEAEKTAVPDIARIWFSVESEKDTVEVAQEDSSKKINEVMKYLEDKKINKKDIKTTGYNVYPRYEYQKKQVVCMSYPCFPDDGERVLKGYTVSQSVEIKLRDTDMVGDILAGIGSRGVTNINGPSFEIDEPEALEQAAKEEAIAQAREKAEKLAKALGVKLGDVVSFNESGGGYPMYYRGASLSKDSMGGAEAAMPPAVPTGENTITAYVTVSYEIR